MIKAPLTTDATIANVEAFLATQYGHHVIALRIARYYALLVQRAQRAARARWLRWLRIVMVMDALGLTVLAGYLLAGGAR